MRTAPFRHLFPFNPPTMNHRNKRQLSRLKEHLDSIMENEENFEKTDRLYARIIYFSHDTSTRDIQNVMKPIFDALRTRIYEDDKSIMEFEGIRLDMKRTGVWFEYECDLTAGFEFESVSSASSWFLEIGQLPKKTENLVTVEWIEIGEE